MKIYLNQFLLDLLELVFQLFQQPLLHLHHLLQMILVQHLLLHYFLVMDLLAEYFLILLLLELHYHLLHLIHLVNLFQDFDLLLHLHHLQM
jgi:hypothetical protein